MRARPGRREAVSLLRPRLAGQPGLYYSAACAPTTRGRCYERPLHCPVPRGPDSAEFRPAAAWSQRGDLLRLAILRKYEQITK